MDETQPPDQSQAPPAQPDQTPISVNVAGLGPVQFPAGTSRDVMQQAIDARIAQQHVDKKEDVPHPLVQRLLSALPSALGPLGYFFGTSEGRQNLPAAGGATGGMVGGVPGAVAGGAAGEAVKEGLNAITGEAPVPSTPGGVAASVVGSGGAQGAMQAIAPAITATASKVAPWLMQSAVKPAFSSIEDMVKTGDAPQVVKTLLKDGISVTAGGIRRLNALIATGQGAIKSILSSPDAGLVDPMSALGPLQETAEKFAKQGTPQTDLATIRQAASDFIDAWVKDPTTGALKPKWSSELANEVKQGTYRKASDAAYGEMSTAAKESQKALGRGIKQGIEAANPNTPIAAMNAQQGDRIDALEVVGRRWAMAHNLDPAGLAPTATKGAGFLTMLFARSPAVKSMIANGLYNQAAAIAGISPNVIRAAVASLASGDDKQ